MKKKLFKKKNYGSLGPPGKVKSNTCRAFKSQVNFFNSFGPVLPPLFGFIKTTSGLTTVRFEAEMGGLIMKARVDWRDGAKCWLELCTLRLADVELVALMLVGDNGGSLNDVNSLTRLELLAVLLLLMLLLLEFDDDAAGAGSVWWYLLEERK